VNWLGVGTIPLKLLVGFISTEGGSWICEIVPECRVSGTAWGREVSCSCDCSCSGGSSWVCLMISSDVSTISSSADCW
jgi:hypothetical protein